MPQAGPALHSLAGEHFQAWHIPQQFHDPLAGFVRLLAVPLKWGLNDLVYLVAADLLPGLKAWGHTQQAHLRVGAGVGAHAPKVGPAPGVFLHPHKGRSLVLKPPRLQDPDPLCNIWESCPQKTGCPPPRRFSAPADCIYPRLSWLGTVSAPCLGSFSWSRAGGTPTGDPHRLRNTADQVAGESPPLSAPLSIRRRSAAVTNSSTMPRSRRSRRVGE